MDVHFTINGKPMGKQRPKFVRRGKFVSTYTPNETVTYENLVKLSYKSEYGDFMFPDVPLEMEIKVFMAIPISTSKKKMSGYVTETIPYTHKPDWDNFGKIICDGLNQVAYHDDSQICFATVSKLYSQKPRVEVYIKEYEIKKDE